MRGRAWRRHKQDLFLKRRLGKYLYSHWWSLQNANHSWSGDATIIDFIGSKEYFIAKTLSTQGHDTKNKIKYSPNKNSNYWRDYKHQTREYQKRIFLEILKENEKESQ